MRSYKTEALILSSRDLGEADRVLNVFSPNLGVFTVKVRGARRIKSRLAGPLQMFSRVELFAVKGGKIDTVTGVVAKKSREGIKKSFLKVAAASLVAGTIRDFIKEGDARLFDEADAVLDEIESGDREMFFGSAFAWRLIALSGFVPELYLCVLCGQKLSEGDYYFAPRNGGLLCVAEQRQGSKLNLLEIKTLRFICENDTFGLKRLKNPVEGIKLHGLLLDYLTEHIGQPPKALEFAYKLNEENDRIAKRTL